MELFRIEFDRYIHYLLRTSPRKEEFERQFHEVLFKVISTREFNVLHGLSKCKDFEEITKWLSKLEGKKIQIQSVRKRAERALKNVKQRLDECINSAKGSGR